MKQARDLFLLSTIAYQQGKHSDSGKLFAAAMASSDASEFLDLLNEEQTVTSGSLVAASASLSNSIEESVEAATQSFSLALSSSAEDEESSDVPTPTEEDDGEDFEEGDEYVDDIDTDMPGQKVLPSSLSSTSFKPKTKIIISASLNSPIKLRTV